MCPYPSPHATSASAQGQRQRYRLVALERLCWRLGTTSLEAVRGNLEALLQARIERDELKRAPYWTEIVEEKAGLWVLKEREAPYGLDGRALDRGVFRASVEAEWREQS